MIDDHVILLDIPVVYGWFLRKASVPSRARPLGKPKELAHTEYRRKMS
jgi:hypothetical protein